jgi:minor histocompatibility antigen H13
MTDCFLSGHSSSTTIVNLFILQMVLQVVKQGVVGKVTGSLAVPHVGLVICRELATTGTMSAGIMAAYVGLGAMLVAPTFATVPVHVQMLGLSTLVIFIASCHAADRERKRQRDGDDAEPRDVISGNQAYRFPIIASISLCSMFFAFKYLPKAWVSLALTLYGVIFGGFAFAQTLVPALEKIPGLPSLATKEFGHKDYVLVTPLDIISLFLAAPVAVWYYKTRSWLANNILASSLGLTAIDILALGDFKSGAVLLSGLFIYDIFWVFGSKSVFGSNVMVSVAKNFECVNDFSSVRWVRYQCRD